MEHYFDYNATTPCDARVVAAMLPFLTEQFANPSPLYSAARQVKAALEIARQQVAQLAGCSASEVTFTSGGTEANNWAIRALVQERSYYRLALSRIEHPSVIEPARALERQGVELKWIEVNRHGEIDLDQLHDRLQQGVDGVAVMAANNETGVVQPLAEIGALCRQYPTRWHCDAVQLAGKGPLDYRTLGCSSMSLSAHKLYGPKGVGALITDKSHHWEPLQRGGGQERGRRAGTENVAAVVGFGVAAESMVQELAAVQSHLQQLREQCQQELQRQLPEAVIFGAEAQHRLPNTLFFALPGLEAAALIMALDRDGFALGSGSACGSGRYRASPVLQAMGVETELAAGAVRISFGRESRPEAVTALITALRRSYQSLTSLATLAW